MDSGTFFSKEKWIPVVHDRNLSYPTKRQENMASINFGRFIFRTPKFSDVFNFGQAFVRN